MKNNYLLTSLFLFTASITTFAQVGIGTTTPRGAFEINSSTHGFLPPQVALTSADTASPVVNPQDSGLPLEGTIVYNTNTAGTSPNNVSPGYYYWNGTAWKKFADANTFNNSTSIDTEDTIRVLLDKEHTGPNTPVLGGLTGVPGPLLYFFENGRMEEMFFTLQLPHNWKEGSTIYPRVHWTPSTTTGGSVKWNLDYSWADLDTVSPATFPTVSTISGVSAGSHIMNQHILTKLDNGIPNTGIDGTGKHSSSVLICRAWRDPNDADDTYTENAGGLSLDFVIIITNN